MQGMWVPQDDYEDGQCLECGDDYYWHKHDEDPVLCDSCIRQRDFCEDGPT